MWGQPISVEFQQQDLTLFPTSTTTTMATAQPSQAATQGTGGPTSMVPGPASDHSGLSSGAAAGIGIAVALCALGMIAGIIFLFLRRRRTKVKGHPTRFEDDSGNQWYSRRQELEGTSFDKSMQSFTNIQEVDRRNTRGHQGPLLSRSTPRVELE